MKELILEAAHRYFDADIKQSAPLPMLALIVMLVGFYLSRMLIPATSLAHTFFTMLIIQHRE
jgi:hypothetical protein